MAMQKAVWVNARGAYFDTEAEADLSDLEHSIRSLITSQFSDADGRVFGVNDIIRFIFVNHSEINKVTDQIAPALRAKLEQSR